MTDRGYITDESDYNDPRWERYSEKELLMPARSTMTFLRRLLDRKRCRYEDCFEEHPIARDNEQTTCPTCRAYMGLYKTG